VGPVAPVVRAAAAQPVPASDRYGDGMSTAPVSGREDPRWNGPSQRVR